MGKPKQSTDSASCKPSIELDAVLETLPEVPSDRGCDVKTCLCLKAMVQCYLLGLSIFTFIFVHVHQSTHTNSMNAKK